MFPLPFVVEKFVDYCKSFIDTHGWQGAMVFLMGCYTLVLGISVIIEELT